MGASKYDTWYKCQRTSTIKPPTLWCEEGTWQWRYQFSESRSQFRHRNRMLKMFFRTRVRWNGHRLRTQSCLVEVCERCFRCAKGCSGVGVVRYLMGELCAQSNMVEVMPHARSSVFLQFKNQHHVWQTNTMDQYVGEWSSCEGFFPPFFVAVVVRGQHNEVPPRGGAGVRRLIFTIIGTFFLFFWSPSLWSPSFWCKTLLSHGQKCFNNKKWVGMSSFVVLGTNCSQFFYWKNTFDNI